ncbi:AGPHD1 [Mytilus coruscus]|uniref:AGPHD1 n=1 Tax=Mytilus coruscus TaxID=42192 RepID=A0A6J8AD13_MYTCO|nr:AGPHD1 [Mytilus coruscus]
MTEGAQSQSQHIKGRTEDQVIQLDTDESKTMLKPNQQIRPLIPNKCIRDFALKLYGMNVLKFEELDSFEDRNYHIIVDPVINNNYIKDLSKTGYVLKVLNLKDSKTPGFIEINSPYIFHMMKYMEGEIAITKPYVPVTLFNIGKFAGRLQNALEDFDNAFLRERVFQWNLAECSRILDFVFALESKEYAQLVNIIIKEYIKEVKPVLGQLRKGKTPSDSSVFLTDKCT